MTTWTEAQVVTLAPDAGSLAAGRALAAPRHWVSLGTDADALWGMCQGSGKNPYQTQIDLTEPAFKCSCPSRKFPCKHALGLFLAYVATPAAFAATAPPAWVVEWRAGRARRAETKANAAEEQAEKPVDLAAQAKRAARREDNVQAGLQELALRLHDLLRNGLAQPECQTYAYWNDIAARMVDAQAPGLARLLRALPGTLAAGDDRYARALHKVAGLHLLIEGFSRLDTLPPGLREEIRALIGWTAKGEELLQGDGVRDCWLVTGRRVDEEDRLITQRTWLFGLTTGQPALVLAFAPPGQPLDVSLPPGLLLDAELVYYPGNLPLRAVVKTRTPVTAPTAPPTGLPDLAALYAAYGAALARNPWLEAFPAQLAGVICYPRGAGWVLHDAAGAAVPVHPRCSWGWHLLAHTGGHPGWLMGEWDGYAFLPLACWAEGEVINFG